MKTVKINELTFQLPEAWNELTLTAALAIAQTWHRDQDPVKAKLAGFTAITRIRLSSNKSRFRTVWLHFPKRMKYLVKIDDLNQVLSAFNFLFNYKEQEDGTINVSLNPRLTQQLQPEIKLFGNRYIAPDHGLGDISWLQFTSLEVYFESAQKRPENFKYWLASYFRPKATKGETFVDRPTAIALQDFEKCPDSIAALAMIHYLGCKNYLATLYPEVFPSPDDNEPKAEKGSALWHFMAITDILSDGQVNNYAGVRNALAYDVLHRLKQASIEREKIKQHAQKIKNRHV